MSERLAIEVEGLTKSYGSHQALRGIDLRVPEGEIYGLLGPNGAGKTTTIEILEGYRSRDGGTVSVLGTDPAHAGSRWRARIGIVLQACAVQPQLTVAELVDQYGGLYPEPRTVEETLRLVGLRELRDVRASRLSGGQLRRLDVALGIVGRPALLFLDEPTTGFDPRARREAWSTVSALREAGTTIVLTTHYMDEAQELADRIGVLVAGALVAEGTPGEVGAGLAQESHIRFELPAKHGSTADDLPRYDREVWQVRGREAETSTREPLRLLGMLDAWAAAGAATVSNLEVRNPDLEDVYLQLVDRQPANEAAAK